MWVQKTKPLEDTHLLWRWPLGLQLILVQALPEHPAQARHGLHTIQERGVLSCVLVAL